MILYNRTSYKENKNNNPLYWLCGLFVLFLFSFHRNIRMDKSVFEYYATQTGLFLPNARVYMVKSLASLPVWLHSFETLTDHRSRFSLAGVLFVDVRMLFTGFLIVGWLSNYKSELAPYFDTDDTITLIITKPPYSFRFVYSMLLLLHSSFWYICYGYCYCVITIKFTSDIFIVWKGSIEYSMLS